MTPMNADKSNNPPMNAEAPSKFGVHRRPSAFIGVWFERTAATINTNEEQLPDADERR